MLAFVLLDPLVGVLLGPEQARRDGVTMALERAFGWGVPYLVGRLNYGDPDGPARLLRHIVAGRPGDHPRLPVRGGRRPALLPRGAPLRPPLQRRDGRPTRRLAARGPLRQRPATGGLDGDGQPRRIAAWTAGAWTSRRFPAWAAAGLLVLATLSCRGVYGYVDLAAGAAALLLAAAYGSRVPLQTLALLPAVYMAARLGGLWDARFLTDLAQKAVGRGGTVAFRLAAEEDWLARSATAISPWGCDLPLACPPSSRPAHWPNGW